MDCLCIKSFFFNNKTLELGKCWKPYFKWDHNVTYLRDSKIIYTAEVKCEHHFWSVTVSTKLNSVNFHKII